MRVKFAIASLALLFATSCMARRHDYQRGELLQMDSTSCGMQEKDGKTFAGEILGTDGQHKKSVEVLCQDGMRRAVSFDAVSCLTCTQ